MSEEIPIEELCKPLSAKVMPKSTLYNQSHEPMTDDQAMRRARQAQTESYNRKKKLAGKD
jgi:hypothetical protein